MFICQKLLKKKCDLKKLVIDEQLCYKNDFTLHAHINETQTAETPV